MTCLCGSDEASLVQHRVRHDATADVYRCEVCGLVYLWPRPTAEELDAFYSGPYRRAYPMVAESELARDSARRVDALRAVVGPSSRVADIGAGSGAFVDAIRPHVREIVGVEPDVGGSIDDLAGEFDVVTAFHVLEHVLDPSAFLRRLAGLLCDDGVLVVEVPNIDDALVSVYDIPAFRAFYFMSAHLWYFSPPTLADAINRAGLEGRVEPVQRYDLSNHLVWLRDGKPGGFGVFPIASDVNDAYARSLVAAGVADTLWVAARRTT
jgi:SAM-dependent methyltransferase